MWIKIHHYTLIWTPTEGTNKGWGTIWLYFQKEPSTSITQLSLEEFQVISDLLRKEDPVYWDADALRLSTEPEPVGEEET